MSILEREENRISTGKKTPLKHRKNQLRKISHVKCHTRIGLGFSVLRFSTRATIEKMFGNSAEEHYLGKIFMLKYGFSTAIKISNCLDVLTTVHLQFVVSSLGNNTTITVRVHVTMWGIWSEYLFGVSPRRPDFNYIKLSLMVYD